MVTPKESLLAHLVEWHPTAAGNGSFDRLIHQALIVIHTNAHHWFNVDHDHGPSSIGLSAGDNVRARCPITRLVDCKARDCELHYMLNVVVVEHVKMSELREGDVIRCYGMRVRISNPKRYPRGNPHNDTATHWDGDIIEGDHPYGWKEATWCIQSADWVDWSREYRCPVCLGETAYGKCVTDAQHTDGNSNV